jgi:CHAT domain-containing protein
VGPLVEDLRYTTGKFALGDDYARRHGARLAREAADRLASLARIALSPVEDEIARARRVVVVPHGAWHLVPFAALPVGGRPLVERCTLAMTPALGALTRDIAEARGAPLVLASSDAGAPSIDDEARAVAAALPGARLLEGADARADAIAAAAAPSCVHVAAHGRYRPDAPAMSGVLLADGWLRAIDFASLRLPGSLVVLSGCETGVARAGPGDEVHGLVRGVLASGAADLVASLWRVGDDSARGLMSEFHARRAAGASAEDALAGTQRDAIARGLPVWAWAAFALWTRRASS